MTDMNNPNDGGYGQWPQQVPPRQPHPPQGLPPYPPQGQQPPYGYPVDDAAATALLPPVPALDDAAATTLLPPVPAVDEAATALLPPVPPLDDAATTLLPPVTVSGALPVAPPSFQPQAPFQQSAPYPPQVQAPFTPQAPVQPQPQPQPPFQPQPRPGRHAAPARAAAPQPVAQQPVAPAGMPPQPAVPVFDPPTMALKRPDVPAGPPYPGVPSQQPQARAQAQPQPLPQGPAGRTGSPIIDPGLQPALITAAVAALLAGGAALGQVALALVVAALQLLTAAGWFRLNGMWPARQGILLAALAGLTADAAVLLADSEGSAAAVVGTLGGFFLLVLVLQTFRPSDPKERFYALTVLGSATVVTALCTMLLLADWVPAGVGAVALATVLAAAPLPGPKQLGPVLGLAAAVLLGLLVGAPLALGALAGLGSLIGRRVAAYDFPSRFVHMTAGVALPLAVAAPLIWIATDLLV
ncbi:hypothetical protein [Streptomyces sp. Y1]|uniref:Uncharacterized protein n=1 Tax=Streptomyces sp. Y1 TaxID=3238634 RepID=A0AB39TKC8_9ACTN